MMGKHLVKKPLRGAELGLSLLDPIILIAKATKGWGIKTRINIGVFGDQTDGQ